MTSRSQVLLKLHLHRLLEPLQVIPRTHLPCKGSWVDVVRNVMHHALRRRVSFGCVAVTFGEAERLAVLTGPHSRRGRGGVGGGGEGEQEEEEEGQ